MKVVYWSVWYRWLWWKRCRSWHQQCQWWCM